MMRPLSGFEDLSKRGADVRYALACRESRKIQRPSGTVCLADDGRRGQ
jgi:hypothetical protein